MKLKPGKGQGRVRGLAAKEGAEQDQGSCLACPTPLSLWGSRFSNWTVTRTALDDEHAEPCNCRCRLSMCTLMTAKLLISVSAFLADLWRTGRGEAKGQGEAELRAGAGGGALKREPSLGPARALSPSSASGVLGVQEGAGHEGHVCAHAHSMRQVLSLVSALLLTSVCF